MSFQAFAEAARRVLHEVHLTRADDMRRMPRDLAPLFGADELTRSWPATPNAS